MTETHPSKQIIILEEDLRIANQLVVSLGNRKESNAQPGSGGQFQQVQCSVYKSKADFYTTDPNSWDLVITSSQFNEGAGLEILSYVQGFRPDVPVIMTGTLENVNEVIESIQAGATDFLLLTDHEIRKFPLVVQKCLAMQMLQKQNEFLSEEFSHSIASLAVKNHELEQLIQQLEMMVNTDELTSLHNRRWLNTTLQQRWAESKRNNAPLAFLMIDLDGFKNLNDRSGHQRGDEILCLAARVIEENCRSIDISARYGGDEFCVILPSTDPKAAMLAANRIASAFENAIALVTWLDVTISMSIGVAHVNVAAAKDAAELIRHADQAMYKAKKDVEVHVALYEGENRTAA